MRLGTARPGKSCIAWAEAVFLKSPRQRLTRDASKTVGRWVIPPPTLRAIVSTNFRSELLDVARDYERLAERADPRLVGEQKKTISRGAPERLLETAPQRLAAGRSNSLSQHSEFLDCSLKSLHLFLGVP